MTPEIQALVTKLELHSDKKCVSVNWEPLAVKFMKEAAAALSELAEHHKNLKANEARVREHYLARLEAAEAALSAHLEALEDAEALVKAIDACLPHMASHEMFAYAHGQRYVGPTFEKELQALKHRLAALASPRQQEQEHKDKEADHARMDSQT